MARRKTYIVWLSSHSKVKTTSTSAYNAKLRAWNDIKDSYRYGWNNKAQFMKRAKAELA